MDGSLSGRLLVATPMLRDPNFDRTVVMILEHVAEGAIGVVLNRPGELDVGAVLPSWGRLGAEPALIFWGGPVQPDGVIGLFQVADGAEPPLGWNAVTDRLGVIDLETDPDTIADGVGRLRPFAGYAGWAAHQLDAEVEAQAWWTVDAEQADALTVEPDDLWHRVLGRQSGRLAWMANYPDDPAVN
jgi:putative transcriptional regulator